MTKTSRIVRNHRPAKFSSHKYTCCKRCGHPHSVYHKFKLYRICLKDLAYKGQISGTEKASW